MGGNLVCVRCEFFSGGGKGGERERNGRLTVVRVILVGV